MKGIILAGGSGTRLYPLTKTICKQLLPVYNKPLIYYPLSALMLAGIRDVLIITAPRHNEQFQEQLGDGSHLGVNIEYAVQPKPEGLAQAFLIGERFIGNSACALALGDNLLFGHGLSDKLQHAARIKSGGHVFAHRVADPSAYGVVVLDADDHPLRIVEKPKDLISNWAVIGIYFYDNDVIGIARDLKPSARGEFEITDVNAIYLAQKRLQVTKLGRGYTWFDAGTHEDLLRAGEFVRTIEDRQGNGIGCLEEIAYHMGYIDLDRLARVAHEYAKTSYGAYLSSVLTSLADAR